jgi:hypothetical protein
MGERNSPKLRAIAEDSRETMEGMRQMDLSVVNGRYKRADSRLRPPLTARRESVIANLAADQSTAVSEVSTAAIVSFLSNVRGPVRYVARGAGDRSPTPAITLPSAWRAT